MELFEDFETSGGGFTQTSILWEKGTPTAGPGMAFSGNQVWATRLAGDYPDRARDSLLSPIYRLPAGTEPVLEFQSWLDRTCCDGAIVELSSDGGSSFTTLEILVGSRDVYRQLSYDLSPEAGSDVQVRLRFISNTSGTAAGWYVDDFSARTRRKSNTGSTQRPSRWSFGRWRVSIRV